RPKEDAGLLAGLNSVRRDQIVGIAMTNRDAQAIAHNAVLLRQTIFDTPAKEDADVVSAQCVVADDGALRAGARMQAQPCVVLADAVLNDHIMANLPTDAVAVIVACSHVIYVNAVAVLKKDASGIVAVQFSIILPIAIQHEPLDADIVHHLAADDREQRG